MVVKAADALAIVTGPLTKLGRRLDASHLKLTTKPLEDAAKALPKSSGMMIWVRI